MYILLLGIIIFFGVHLIPSLGRLRNRIITHIGENPYKALYAITALLGLILIIVGKSNAVYEPIWQPPLWSKNVAVVTMLLSIILIVAADMKSNIKRFVRHPMLLGIALWSGVHLFANGDLASIFLFGAFGTFSLFAMFSANKRGAKTQEKKYPVTKDAVTIFAGIVAYGVFIKFLHPLLIGVTII